MTRYLTRSNWREKGLFWLEVWGSSPPQPLESPVWRGWSSRVHPQKGEQWLLLLRVLYLWFPFSVSLWKGSTHILLTSVKRLQEHKLPGTGCVSWLIAKPIQKQTLTTALVRAWPGSERLASLTSSYINLEKDFEPLLGTSVGGSYQLEQGRIEHKTALWGWRDASAVRVLAVLCQNGAWFPPPTHLSPALGESRKPFSLSASAPALTTYTEWLI